MDITKQPYELSIWEDVLDTTEGRYQEEKLAVIGSDTMTSQLRALNPKLVQNTNGSNTLTFEMYYKYWDNDAQDWMFNPYCARGEGTKNYLTNERKLKLRFGYKYKDDGSYFLDKNGKKVPQWYDFVIKDISEGSQDYTFRYTCKDQFLNKLGKTGFEIELNNELNNNMGTVYELGAEVVKDTDWEVIQPGDLPIELEDGEELSADYIKQYISEQVFPLHLKEGKWTLKEISDPSKTISAPTGEGTYVYAFYSCLSSPYISRLQVLYRENWKDIKFDNDHDIADATLCYLQWDGKEVTNLPNINTNYQIYFPNNSEILNSDEVRRGKRVAYKPLTKYESLLQKTATIYKKGTEDWFGYTESKYPYPANYITNGQNFATTSGWNADKNSSVSIGVNPPAETPGVITERTPYLSVNTTYLPWAKNTKYYVGDIVTYNNKYYKCITEHTSQESFSDTDWNTDVLKPLIFNSGIYDNRRYIKQFAAGADEWCLRVKIYSLSGETKTYHEPITAYIASYSYNGSSDEYTIKDKYFEFTKYSQTDTGYDYYLATCGKDINQTNFIDNSTQIGLFIEAPANKLRIEEIQVFQKYLSNGTTGEIIVPGGAVSGPYTTFYTYYNTVDCATAEDVIRYTYQSPQSAYTATYDTQYQKRSSVEVSESNCFNILSTLSETFKCWCRYIVDRDPDTGKLVWDNENKKYKKYVLFTEKIGRDNYASFTYGINLKDVTRQLDSNSITTKIIVKPNANNYALNGSGTCTIQNAKNNFAGENFILNFNHYFDKDMLDANKVQDDLYKSIIFEKEKTVQEYKCSLPEQYFEITGVYRNNGTEKNYLKYTVNIDHIKLADVESGQVFVEYTDFDCSGYYTKLHKLNLKLKANNEKLAGSINTLGKGTLLAQQASELQFLTEAVNAAETEQREVIDTLEAYTQLSAHKDFGVSIKVNGEWQVGTWSTGKGSGDERYKKDDKTKAYVDDITQIQTSLVSYEEQLKTVKQNYEQTVSEYNTLIAANTDLISQKKELHKKFYKKYSSFLQEGSWISEDYVDDNEYYADADRTLLNSCIPAISYTINLLELSQLPGYENYHFEVGNATNVIDTEFFGYEKINGIKTPRKQNVIVSEVAWSLDQPQNNTIKVQTYKNAFEDLFQKITATSQSLTYAEGSYNKVANIISSDGVLTSDVLQTSIDQNNLVIANAKDQSVKWDETGITISSLSQQNEIVRLVSGGIMLSKDGGATWTTGITGKGINASMITTGKLNTNIIEIYDGANPTFRWDDTGINAFADENGSYSFTKYVRFDKWGIYGINGISNTFKPTSIQAIKDSGTSSFGLTWDEFWLKNKYGDGYVSISSKDDFIINDGTHNRIKIGNLGTHESPQYGISIWNATGTSVFQTDNQGNLIITGKIDATSGEIGGWTIGEGLLYSGKDETETSSYVAMDSTNSNYAFWAGKKDATKAPFSVTRDGKLTTKNINITGGSMEIGNFKVSSTGTLSATGASISGAINATSGTFNGTINASGGNFTGNVSVGTGGSITLGSGISLSNDGNIYLNNGEIIGQKSSTSAYWEIKTNIQSVNGTSNYTVFEPDGDIKLTHPTRNQIRLNNVTVSNNSIGDWTTGNMYLGCVNLYVGETGGSGKIYLNGSEFKPSGTAVFG